MAAKKQAAAEEEGKPRAPAKTESASSQLDGFLTKSMPEIEVAAQQALAELAQVSASYSVYCLNALAILPIPD